MNFNYAKDRLSLRSIKSLIVIGQNFKPGILLEVTYDSNNNVIWFRDFPHFPNNDYWDNKMNRFEFNLANFRLATEEEIQKRRSQDLPLIQFKEG